MNQKSNEPADSPQPGTYKHYKGQMYQVFGMAQHSETDEWMVVYQALYGKFGFWLRPLSVWLEPVTTTSSGGSEANENRSSDNIQQRFELVTPASESLTQLSKQPSI